MPPIDVTTPVVVLRLDHHGALGIVRSLGRLGVPCWGVHQSSDAPALKSAYACGGFVWDIHREPAARSLAFLLQLAGDLGGRPILLPSNDETALFVAENAAQLRSAWRFQENGARLVRQLYDKRAMHALAQKLGMPTAQTLFPRSREELREAEVRFPVVLKAGDGIHIAHRTGEKMVIVHSAGELLEAYDRLEDPEQPSLMLQEYIPGGEDSQWMFNGYFDARSDCLFGVTGKKLRQSPVYTGMTSLGVCLHNATVDRLTRDFMKAIGYRGILDIGYRYDARDGAYKVLDVNPRVGSTFRLFVGDDGMDVVRALYLDLTGQPVPPSRSCQGRKWLVEELDLASSIRYAKDGVLGAGEWLRSFQGVRESGWFAADDLGPFADLCVRVAANRVRRKRPRRDHQAQVTRHFSRSARYWREVYHQTRLEPLVYQERHATALRWVDSLALAPGVRALEVGCGAGYASLALARRGCSVKALDATPEMVAMTQAAAEAAGLSQLQAVHGDVNALPFPEEAFDLVLALGVLPWMASEAQALGEMARVLRRGGWLIASADNRMSLQRVLDPRTSPLWAPPRSLAKRLLRRRPEALPVKNHSPAAVDSLVRAAGLEKIESTSVGFGPFSLFERKLLPEPTSLEVHRTLQRRARAGWPILRAGGSHYLILARKP
jgi:predicted ATP-grasp superfamily ATP-dependent carboligase/ubiquinone/menaquinone biosynthesis C-methylase UbiE